MLHHRATIAGIGVAAAIAVGAAVVANSGGSPHTPTGPTVSTTAVKSQTANVNGRSEQILADASGQPLYYYAPDSATTSHVSGRLAALWPPVVAPAASAAHGPNGSVTVVRDSHGNQLAYNGHLLYTFVSDRRGDVTGQGVQNFFVATPGLSKEAGSANANANANANTGNSTYGGY